MNRPTEIRTGSAVAHPLGILLLMLMCLPDSFVSAAITNTKLNEPLGVNEAVRSFWISPDSQWVVYTIQSGNTQTTDLFSVPILGGPSVQLNTVMAPGSEVAGIQFSPDSRRVLLLAPLDTTGFRELYNVSIEGPAHERIKLNGPLVTDGDVLAYELSPDGSRVVYLADQETDNVHELYSVPIEGPGTAGVKISAPLSADRRVTDYDISPDGEYVVYRADLQLDDVYELYSVPIQGPDSAWVKLNGPLATNGDVTPDFVISPDSSRVVYTARQLSTTLDDLFSVPIEGPAGLGRRINAPLGTGGYIWTGYQVTPDSSRVIYHAQLGSGMTSELFTTPIDGPETEAEKISHPIPNNYYIEASKISPDSARVVYTSVSGNGDLSELYSVPADGPASESVRLSVEALVDEVAGFFQISPDSSRVAFIGDQGTGKNELYSTLIDQWGLTKLNRPLNSLEEMSGRFQISPDGRQVAYTADRINLIAHQNGINLYTAPIDGPGTASIALNRPAIRTGAVSNFEYSPDGLCIVYIGDQETDEIFELYVSSWRPTIVEEWRLYR